jgi:SAM-dependent MidA family methyltransferase
MDLAEMESNQQKPVEKADPKKKSAKVSESDEPDKGHYVICSDEILETLPVDAVLRAKNIATSTSRDFGKITDFLFISLPLKSFY